jgi:hypothetical protein
MVEGFLPRLALALAAASLLAGPARLQFLDTFDAPTVEEWPDEDTRLVRIYGPDGGDEPFMSFTYKRRK